MTMIAATEDVDMNVTTTTVIATCRAVDGTTVRLTTLMIYRLLCLRHTWKEVVRDDCQARKLNKEDAVDRCKWRKVIKEVR